MKCVGSLNNVTAPGFKLDAKNIETKDLEAHIIHELDKDPRDIEYRLMVFYGGAFFGTFSTSLTIRFRAKNPKEHKTVKDAIQAVLKEAFPFQKISFYGYIQNA